VTGAVRGCARAVTTWVGRHVVGLFVAVGAAAYVLGVVGMRAYLGSLQRQNPPEATLTWPNALYFAGTMFVGDTTPFQGFGRYPVTLELARFLAPLATTIGLAKAAGAIFAEQVGGWRARHSRGHVVVCGPGPAAAIVAAGAREEGHRVVLVSGRAGDGAEKLASGILEIPGDPRDTATLRAAGVGRAARLVICSEQGLGSVSVAAVARDLAWRSRSRPARRGLRWARSWRDRPLECFAQAGDVDLVVPLQVRAAVRPADATFVVSFFSIEAVGARILAGRDVPGLDADAPREVVVVGTTAFGRALVIELARARRSWLGRGASPLPVALAATDATEVVAALSERYHVVRSFLRLRAIPPSVPTLMATRPSHLYVCDDGMETSSMLALDVARATEARGSAATDRPVVTLQLGRLEEGRRDAAALEGSGGVLDDADGSLRFFAMYDEACRPAEIYGETFVRMARVIHDDYVQDRLAENFAMRSLAALRPWDELSETFQQSNIAQARGYVVGLAALGYVVVPTEDEPVPLLFTQDEVESLARAEHARWAAEMRNRGYDYGAERVDDGPRPRHPNLLEWDDLPEGIRDRNRNPMRQISDILALVDLEIVRRTLS
jgi:RyR domain